MKKISTIILCLLCHFFSYSGQEKRVEAFTEFQTNVNNIARTYTHHLNNALP